jgi:hypothetical protein
MGLVLHIDHEARRLTTTASGPLTLDDIVEHLRTEVQEGVLAYPERVDVREASIHLTGDQVRQVAAHLSDLAIYQPVGPTAIIVGADYAFGLVRMFSLLLDPHGRIGAFRDPRAADAWLEQQTA